MPIRYIVTFKDGMPEEEVKSYIEKMEASGGKVERYSLFPGAMVEMPDGYVGAMDDHVVVRTVEKDSIVTTQS